ncbi:MULTISPECIES: 16S rRNA (cytosine(967)-C(5))-methyltransferase RsmB [Providencia]|uniref:16S rRNA (cytosine(967)-C(5))-methyltransferase n=1 Tax=Providencia rettgeri TaxID=587 RepID=A0A9N8D3U7_PRORE|nr:MULTISPECIES: 16S rRNA (cytosine(967)-C(5))-methyltransferase RsmB [Providencia]MBN7843909.1 16S rRNA (cytosine(967)-C(5))-methyltransferase RsmB [Providencia rettgeri]MBN7855205.1 16S rRNA (cytosine(967)-C(5))-methyltransferase RsmB [Providencia rettgeri]MBN7863070.1 16S rRNA (cytosine(967)-C(5))-methyltransferase RsmB [Providencia rettgeri]MBN7872301.1 16S rRNA (cytosine(967)-C(5))-methyltransferase RsmB [Providencia rettgeri]MBN7896104.1 16S rRNA (cytosine(967)-C(5))-methyltransferase Rs
MKNTYNLRSIAATAIFQVLDNGQSLSTVLPDLQRNINDKDKALLQEICFGVLRYLPKLEWFISQLMEKPLTGKQRALHYLIMVGIYQLLYTRIPPHAALAETVDGAVALKKPQLKGLINGVLRSFQRQQAQLEERIANNTSQYLHPSWLLKRLQTAYPEDWQSIIEANNQRPPMWLRVNSQHHTAAQYLNLLEQSEITAHLHPSHPNAIRLDEPTAVSRLPGFEDGWSTVQDVSAQGCAELLEPQNGESILDLCAAPGGKTTHILELAPRANVIAVDIDEYRLKRVKENLIRLKQHAVVIQGDGTQPEKWAKDQQFDRILLDAPCSATGVIRRHPDIKWLRRDSDINELAQLQAQILEAIWPYLKPGGTLLYATCSIMPEENGKQIQNFLSKHNDASLNDGTDAGLQVLPSTNGGDGFFYARLVKKV